MATGGASAPIAEIERLYAAGHTQLEAARAVGLSKSAVWRAMRDHGIPARVAARRRGLPYRERLLSQLVIDPSGCLLWTGKIDRKGYGRIWIDGRHELVHRVLWKLWVGPIPPSLELDHVRELGCTHRNCASVPHLEPVTHRLNMMRSAKTHCIKGHPYDLLNTYLKPSGVRECRACKAEANRRYDETHRADRAAYMRAWRARKAAA